MALAAIGIGALGLVYMFVRDALRAEMGMSAVGAVVAPNAEASTGRHAESLLTDNPSQGNSPLRRGVEAPHAGSSGDRESRNGEAIDVEQGPGFSRERIEELLCSWTSETPDVEAMQECVRWMGQNASIVEGSLEATDSPGTYSGKIRIDPVGIEGAFQKSDRQMSVTFSGPPGDGGFLSRDFTIQVQNGEGGDVSGGVVVQAHYDCRDPEVVRSFDSEERIAGWMLNTNAEKGSLMRPIVVSRPSGSSGLRIGRSESEEHVKKREWDWNVEYYHPWWQVLSGISKK